jgi:hypothetical protein
MPSFGPWSSEVHALVHSNSIIRREVLPEIYRDASIDYPGADNRLWWILRMLPKECLRSLTHATVEINRCDDHPYKKILRINVVPGKALEYQIGVLDWRGSELPDVGWEWFQPDFKNRIRAHGLHEVVDGYRGEMLTKLVSDTERSASTDERGRPMG